MKNSSKMVRERKRIIYSHTKVQTYFDIYIYIYIMCGYLRVPVCIYITSISTKKNLYLLNYFDSHRHCRKFFSPSLFDFFEYVVKRALHTLKLKRFVVMPTVVNHQKEKSKGRESVTRKKRIPLRTLCKCDTSTNHYAPLLALCACVCRSLDA